MDQSTVREKEGQTPKTKRKNAINLGIRRNLEHINRRQKKPKGV